MMEPVEPDVLVCIPLRWGAATVPSMLSACSVCQAPVWRSLRAVARYRVLCIPCAIVVMPPGAELAVAPWLLEDLADRDHRPD